MSLSEWVEVDVYGAAEPHAELACDNMTATWSGLPYAELSVTLAYLRYLAMLHQTNHWVARGDAFYGDHELFQRLYERTLEDVDDVAEKAVGLGCEQNVSLPSQLGQLVAVAKAATSPQTVPTGSELAQASLQAECAFLRVLSELHASLRQSGSSTAGVDNLLQQVADRHERHVYLLRRRCVRPSLGL